MIVYLCTQHDSNLYIAFEVNGIDVPKSILELPGFIMQLDDIKQSISLYETLCVTRENMTTFLKRKISLPNNYEMNSITNAHKPKKMGASLDF